MHDQNRKTKRLNKSTNILRSKINSPVSSKSLTAHCDSSAYVGCVQIQTMPSALQSNSKKVGLLGSKLAKTGENVTPFFN